MSGFEFLPQPGQYASASEHVAVIADVTSVSGLFAAINAALCLPEGAVDSWTSLYERLTDLSWIRTGATSLVHVSMPQLSPRDLSVYVGLLYDVIQDWEGEGGHVFKAVFPEADQYIVQNIIRSLD